MCAHENNRAQRIVTTSWDDGDRSDLKLAELLGSHGVRGTFYVPILCHGRTLLDHRELKALCTADFEIGAHGYSHRLLRGLSASEVVAEVGLCKTNLEDVLGAPVAMFCYPCGKYDGNVIRALRQAGYSGARTVRMLATQLEFNPFEMPTTVQSYPHGEFAYLRNVLRAAKLSGIGTYSAHHRTLHNWVDLATELFDCVMKDGGIWHLYGHSWEIDELGLWHDLAYVLRYVGNRPNVSYLRNVDVLSHLPAHTIRPVG